MVNSGRTWGSLPGQLCFVNLIVILLPRTPPVPGTYYTYVVYCMLGLPIVICVIGERKLKITWHVTGFVLQAV